MPAAIPVSESENAKRIMTFLERHFATRRTPPSRKEIADALGISTGTVQRWLTRLAATGAVQMESNTARAIYINSPRRTN